MSENNFEIVSGTQKTGWVDRGEYDKCIASLNAVAKKEISKLVRFAEDSSPDRERILKNASVYEKASWTVHARAKTLEKRYGIKNGKADEALKKITEGLGHARRLISERYSTATTGGTK